MSLLVAATSTRCGSALTTRAVIPPQNDADRALSLAVREARGSLKPNTAAYELLRRSEASAEVLDFSECDQLSFSSLVSLDYRFPRLQILDVRNCRCLNNDLFLVLSEAVSLTALYVSGCPLITKAGLQCFIQQLQRKRAEAALLKIIVTCDAIGEGEEAMEQHIASRAAIVRSATSLLLELSQQVALYDPNFDEIASTLLRQVGGDISQFNPTQAALFREVTAYVGRLDFHGLVFAGSANLMYVLRHFTHTVALDLSNACRVTPHVVCVDSNNYICLKNVTTLNLSRCDLLITDKLLQALANRYSRLQYFNFRGCVLASDVTMVSVAIFQDTIRCSLRSVPENTRMFQSTLRDMSRSEDVAITVEWDNPSTMVSTSSCASSRWDLSALQRALPRLEAFPQAYCALQ